MRHVGLPTRNENIPLFQSPPCLHHNSGLQVWLPPGPSPLSHLPQGRCLGSNDLKSLRPTTGSLTITTLDPLSVSPPVKHMEIVHREAVIIILALTVKEVKVGIRYNNFGIITQPI